VIEKDETIIVIGLMIEQWLECIDVKMIENRFD